MKISEERIKWVLRDYEGVLKYCDARYENYHRSYILSLIHISEPTRH